VLVRVNCALQVAKGGQQGCVVSLLQLERQILCLYVCVRGREAKELKGM
jgi:hypothetical protein